MLQGMATTDHFEIVQRFSRIGRERGNGFRRIHGAASAKTDQAAIASVLATHGRAGFAAAWLRHKGLDWAVELLAPEAVHDPAGASKETGS